MKPAEFMTLLLLLMPLAEVHAQKLERQNTELLSDEKYARSASSIVKVVADSGKTTGAGIYLGRHDDGLGFVLTSQRLVAQSRKVVIFVKTKDGGLLGKGVEKWVDFDLDLAVLVIRNFPKEIKPAVFDSNKDTRLNRPYAVIAHSSDNDWKTLSAEPTLDRDQKFILALRDSITYPGSPLLNDRGYIIGMLIDDVTLSGSEGLAAAVRSEALKPVIDEWFRTIPLATKWREKGSGVASWMLAVGGGIVGSAVATAIALGGESGDKTKGLPRPPDPPPAGQ